MPEDVNLTLTIGGEFNLHHHYHHNPSSAQPGAAEILNSIRELKGLIMSLDTSTAAQTADLKLFTDEVDKLIAAFTALGSTNNTTLQAALDAANLDSATQAAILDASDKAIQAEFNKIKAVLTPAAPAAGGGTPVSPPPPITAATPLAVAATTSTLPDAVTGQPYTGHLAITGGTAPYSVVVTTATVNGLTMDATGKVSGTSTTDGEVSFAGTVADSSTPNEHVTFTASFKSAAGVVTV